MADFVLLGGGFNINAAGLLPTKTELRRCFRIIGDGKADSGSVIAFTLYFENDIRGFCSFWALMVELLVGNGGLKGAKGHEGLCGC